MGWDEMGDLNALLDVTAYVVAAVVKTKLITASASSITVHMPANVF